MLPSGTDRFVIVSGGPGAGKTTLIDALERAGHGRTLEAGRAIIQDQVAIGGNAVHWGDKVLFAELMLAHEMRNHHMAEAQPGLVFFDRGVPELPEYFRMSGLPVPAHFERAAELFRYNRKVFLAPPWEEIFGQDAERKQDFAEAVRSFEHCEKVYRDGGYEVIVLPKAGVEKRMTFVLNELGV